MASTLIATVSRWFGFGGALSDNNGPQRGTPYVTTGENLINPGIDGSLQIATVWACVHLLTRTISSLSLRVYNETTTGKVLDETSRLAQILGESPNSRMTAIEFWSCLMLNFLLRGNGYARIERDAAGEVLSLWPMAADQVEPWALDDGSVVYRYMLPQGAVAILASESVLHIKDMGNGTVGLSRLDYMRASMTEAINAQGHANRIFANAGKPAGLLMIDRVLSPEQREKIRQSFGDVASGPTSRLFILEAAMKYSAVGFTPADQQLLETRKFSVEEIGRWFGVPSVLLNAVDMTSYDAIIAGFFKLTVRPILETIEQAIEKRVLSARQVATKCVEFDFEDLLRVSTLQRYELLAKAVQNGIISRNEARAWENLPPVQGADVLTAQVNLAPLDMLGTIASSRASGASAGTIGDTPQGQ